VVNPSTFDGLELNHCKWSHLVCCCAEHDSDWICTKLVFSAERLTKERSQEGSLTALPPIFTLVLAWFLQAIADCQSRGGCTKETPNM